MILSGSRKKNGRQCPTRDYWCYVRDFIPQKKRLPLMTGSAVHTGLHVWYREGSMAAGIQAAEALYREEAGDSLFTEEVELIEKEIASCERMLSGYELQYPTEPWGLARPEMSFRVALGEECWNCHRPYDDLTGYADATNEYVDKICCLTCSVPIHFLSGQIDLIMPWKNRMWMLETKTAKQVSSNYLAAFSRSDQIVGYLYGLSKSLNQEISGCVVNIIKKTVAPQYYREPHLYSQVQKKQFVRDTIDFCNDVERWAVQKYWPKYNDDCYRFGQCPYIGLCNMFKHEPDILDEELYSMGFVKRNLRYCDPGFEDIKEVECKVERPLI